MTGRADRLRTIVGAAEMAAGLPGARRGRLGLRMARIGLLAIFSALPMAALAQGAPEPGPQALQDGTMSADLVRQVLHLDRLDALIVVEIEAEVRADAEADPTGRTYDEQLLKAAEGSLSVERIGALVARDLGAQMEPLDPAAIAPAIAFHASDLGQRVAARSLAARAVMAQPGGIDAALASFDTAASRADPRVDAVRRLVEAQGAVDAAVAYAMNNTLALMAGMDSAVPGSVDPEADRIDKIAGQESSVRAGQTGTTEAMMFLALAPLSDAEMETLIRQAGTPASRRLDAMLQQSYSTAMQTIMYEMGGKLALALRDVSL